MELLYFIFHVAWCFGFCMWSLPLAPASCSWYLHNTLRCTTGNLSDLAVASSLYDKLLCSENVVSVADLRRDRTPRVRGTAALVRDGYGTLRQHKFECGSCEMLFFMVCGVKQICICSVYITAWTWITWFFVVTSNSSCRAGWEWFECPSSGMVRFNND